jgi:hypothetical protein
MTVARQEMHNPVDAFIWQLHSFELLEEISSKRPVRIALCLFHHRSIPENSRNDGQSESPRAEISSALFVA